jgi:micrococcal nuclease
MAMRRAGWILWASLLFGCDNPHSRNVPHSDAAAAQPAAGAPRGSSPASKRALPPDAVSTGTVARVIDGDTLRLSNGDRVRLIGVDTPETVHPNKPVERFGKEAAEFTRGFISGEEITLVYEPFSGASGSFRDRYGRLLAYVYRRRDNADLNAELVRQGYAHAYVNYPFSRMEEFRRYEREARDAGRGLWGSR